MIAEYRGSGPEIRQIGFIREPTGEIEDEDNE